MSGREGGFLTSWRPWPSGPLGNPMIPSDRRAAVAKPAERPEEAVPGPEAATGVECKAVTSSRRRRRRRRPGAPRPGGACALGRERCATTHARKEPRERSGADLARELQSRPPAEVQILRSFAPGLCIFLEVLYERDYSSILGKFCILVPVSASHGHQMPQVGSVLSASWTSEARLLPGQGLRAPMSLAI